MRLALDGDRYSDFVRGRSDAVAVVSQAEVLIMPLIVLAELRAGFRYGTLAQKNEAGLRRFLQSERVSTLWADEATTHVYASLYADLRRAGTPVPLNDLWIAALCVQHDLPLYTRDAHFRRIARLATY